MPLKLMYITNNADVAIIAQKYGVDRIFVDLETIGKQERQANMDSVKSDHTLNDILNIKKILNKSKLLVRINPIHKGSFVEINQAIRNGADIIMLPMWKTVDDVKIFLNIINGRVKTILLLETKEAESCLDDVLKLAGIDEVHIGLNDLCLSYHKKFMFELLSDGTVERICKRIISAEIPFGFGGIGRIGYGMLPAEHILSEHYRLNSSAVILSRSFCNVGNEKSLKDIEEKFRIGVKIIRAYEKMFSEFDEEMFFENKNIVISEVRDIIKKLDRNRVE